MDYTINNHLYEEKSAGDPLTHTEWNNLVSDVNAANSNAGGGTGNVTIGDASNNSHMYINSKGNLCIETTVDNVPSGKKGKINIESKDDLQLKPGDDVIFYSSHRPAANRDEVSVKVTDDADNPVKLQINAADLVLTTKDKASTLEKDTTTGEDIPNTPLYDDPAVMNITVNSAKNTRGYLKVRAQAIDLRSESHGGIALQPKGYDGDVTPHMNKIKFEHGGGDGLEFGTFNTEKSSLFTDEYRFKRDGKILLATRTPVARATDGTDPKYDSSDDTTHYTYTKQADDFYDVIYEGPSGDEYYNYDPTNAADTSVTWEDLVKLVAYMKTNHQGPWSV